ncbi:MAG: hypothetical protein Unbinned838contig1000_17 [Prokaryotic dsDNA virus sp.]|nr:MAG: hypothetical protein Unbinned838contig1000_17 [Prokaryotic dsDNA virus sp.]|tara:strand:+ start:20751 stop:21593 length:843 start_codon:yes stop_codon:yes gene_type:complete
MACESCLNGCVTPQHCSCDCNTCAEANSCDIPVGDTGPVGPQGPQGPPGVNGTNGLPGADGADGCSLTDVYISDGLDGNTTGDVIVTTGTAAPCPNTYNAGNIISTVLGPGGAIPAGVICMWKGNVASIPQGWAFCDGTQGTPDLRGHFVGAFGDNIAYSPFNNLGASGGSFTVNLEPSQIPAHTHSGNTLTAITTIADNGNHRHQIDAANGVTGGMADKGGGNSVGQYWTTWAGIHNHQATTNISGQTGDGTSSGLSAPNGANVDITNKYYVLAFIMKL